MSAANFFPYDEVIKGTGNALILRHGSTVYKIYSITQLLWIRELNFITYVNSLLDKYRIHRSLKYVSVVRPKQIYFCTKPGYIYDSGKLIIDDENPQDYCVFKMKYYRANTAGTSIQKLYKLVPELLLLMAVLNRNSVIHRDIKEANFLLNVAHFSKTRLIIIDFDHTSLNGVVHNGFSTWAYKGPELSEGIPHDERSDVWSFGIMLLRLLCDQAPRAAEIDRQTLLDIFIRKYDQRTPYYDFFLKLLGHCFLDYDTRPTFDELCKMCDMTDYVKLISQVDRRPPLIEIKDSDHWTCFKRIMHLSPSFVLMVYCSRLIGHLQSGLVEVSDERLLAVFLMMSVLYDNRSTLWRRQFEEAKKELKLTVSLKEVCHEIRNLVDLCGRNVLGIVL